MLWWSSLAVGRDSSLVRVLLNSIATTSLHHLVQRFALAEWIVSPDKFVQRAVRVLVRFLLSSDPPLVSIPRPLTSMSRPSCSLLSLWKRVRPLLLVPIRSVLELVVFVLHGHVVRLLPWVRVVWRSRSSEADEWRTCEYSGREQHSESAREYRFRRCSDMNRPTSRCVF